MRTTSFFFVSILLVAPSAALHFRGLEQQPQNTSAVQQQQQQEQQAPKSPTPANTTTVPLNATSPVNATEANSTKLVYFAHPYPGRYGGCGRGWGCGARNLEEYDDEREEKEDEDEQKARPGGTAQNLTTPFNQTSASNATSPMNATEANSSKLVSVVVGHPYGYYGPGPYYGRGCGGWGCGGYGWRKLKEDRGDDEKEEEDEQKARPEGAAQNQTTPSNQTAAGNATRVEGGGAQQQPTNQTANATREGGPGAPQNASVKVNQSEAGAAKHLYAYGGRGYGRRGWGRRGRWGW